MVKLWQLTLVRSSDTPESPQWSPSPSSHQTGFSGQTNLSGWPDRGTASSVADPPPGSEEGLEKLRVRGMKIKDDNTTFISAATRYTNLAPPLVPCGALQKTSKRLRGYNGTIDSRMTALNGASGTDEYVKRFSDTEKW